MSAAMPAATSAAESVLPLPDVPLVSIVIDNYNYARFLRQCIESALHQTHPRVEVVVVDDLSTDASREVIARYAGRITSVLQETNRGQGGAFNAGFAASRGDIVMFLDADDWLYPEAAARVAAAWQRSGLAKIHFRLDLVDADGVRFDTHPAPEVRLDSGDVVPLLLDFGRYETVVTSGNAFSRDALAKSLPMPEQPFRIAADGYLNTVVPFHGSVACVEECLGAYRVHGTNAYAAGRAGDSVDRMLCTRVRKLLLHDSHKETVLRDQAAAAGMPLKANPQLRDPVHLEARLASLRLDPAGHPLRSDRRLRLTLLGMSASRRARLSWPRRAVLAAWFLIAGLAPTRFARAAIRWKLLPSSRPPGIDRQVKRLRRLLS